LISDHPCLKYINISAEQRALDNWTEVFAGADIQVEGLAAECGLSIEA
jgi:hypothetical protein